MRGGRGGGRWRTDRSTPDFLTTFLKVEIVLSSLACFSLLSAVDYLSMVSCLRSSHKMK